ncbi:MAG: LPS export ABC transporter periplasmic protein LptC [Salinivirgaceae bacterium]
MNSVKNKTHSILIYLLKTPILLGVLAFLTSCENDIQKIKELTAKQDSAIVSAKNIEMKYTTLGINNVLLKAPELNRYVEFNKKSHLEFPKGMHISFYNDSGRVTSTIRANYSIYYEDEGRWIARYDVEATNETGEVLNTEYLIWLQNEQIIKSDQFVKITTPDGIIYGDGFESDQTFSSWEVVNGRGLINVETDE